MIITRTPFRFSFFGGGLDYPGWYKENKTKVLCAGLDYYCYITIRELPPFFDHKFRASYSKIEYANKVDEIKHPAIREIIKKYGMGKSIEVSHVGDLPARSGIGSSSAFSVGLINSLEALKGKYINKRDLALEAISIEQIEMNEKVGFQDQCAAALGGIVMTEANEFGISPRRFITNKDYIEYIENNLLMGFDGIARSSQESAQKITKTIMTDRGLGLLKELEQASNKGIEEFGKESDINSLAELTRACRDIKLEINNDNKHERTVQLIKATEKAGSLCTRVMGAGNGGFFTCWAPKHKHQEIKQSVKIKTWVDVKFSSSGSEVIFAEND